MQRHSDELYQPTDYAAKRKPVLPGKKKNIFFLAACMILGGALQVMAADTFTITIDYRAWLEKDEGIILSSDLVAYGDAEASEWLTLVSSSQVDALRYTYEYEDPGDLETVYLVPQILSSTRKIEEQTVPLQNGANDFFTIEKIEVKERENMPDQTEAEGADPSSTIYITASCGQNEYPENMRLKITEEGKEKLYIGGNGYTSTWSSDEGMQIVQYQSQFTIPKSPEEVEKLLPDAYLSFRKINTFYIVDDYDGECDKNYAIQTLRGADGPTSIFIAGKHP